MDPLALKIRPKNPKARTKFIIGPAADIMPFFALLTRPDIMTAPGAANTNPKKDIATARTSMLSNDLNSAKQPYL